MFRIANKNTEREMEKVQNMQMKIRKLMQKFPHGLRLPELEDQLSSHYSDLELSLKEMGFSSLESCLESMPYILYLKPVMGDTYVYPTVPKGEFPLCAIASIPENIDGEASSKKTISTEYHSVLDYNESREQLIPEQILENFRKITERYPDGVRASAFFTTYEEVTGMCLDIHGLGYDCLFSLIWDVPHLFKKKEAVEISDDWYIVPNKVEKGKIGMYARNEDVEKLIWRIRKLLTLNPDGISIQEFLETYSMNFLEALEFLKVGYDSVESFLMSVAREVPLVITSGQQTGRLVQLSKATQGRRDLRFQPQPFLEVPSDIVLPGTQIPTVELPADLNFTLYHNVYVSYVVDPGNFFIMLIGSNHNAKLEAMDHELHRFYQSEEGVQYMLQKPHIRVGLVCAALYWDKFWYRAKIISIISAVHVKVTYLDYGGTWKLPITDLRYLKKEFSELPCQALNSKLACLKPANNLTHWDERASRLMLNIIYNTSLMAKIDSISENGKLSVILCDTNGDEDVFVNDKLMEAGFAEPSLRLDSLNPIQVLQTQLMQAIAKPETFAPILQRLQPSRRLQVGQPSSLPPPGEEPSPEEAPPLDESEVFVDDLFDEFYEKAMSVKQRFVKRSVTVDNFIFHVIDVNGELHVSCADLAALFWSRRDEDHLFRRLHSKKYDLLINKIFANLNPDMFDQVKKFQVKGVKGFDENAELLVFPLKKVIEVLDILGHPSKHLRDEIHLELKSFSYSNPVWMEFHEDVPDLEEVIPVSFSDKEKLERLCLGDLLAMKENLNVELSRNPNYSEGIRLRALISKIMARIYQVVEVCDQSRESNRGGLCEEVNNRIR